MSRSTHNYSVLVFYGSLDVSGVFKGLINISVGFCGGERLANTSNSTKGQGDLAGIFAYGKDEKVFRPSTKRRDPGKNTPVCQERGPLQLLIVIIARSGAVAPADLAQ